jgi:uncharacterized membrane protein
VTVLVALLLIPLLGMSGLVIDVGYAYFTQRTLQAQANAQSFYNQPTPGQLNTIFAQVAEDIQRGSAGLIDNATP